jgi:N-acetyl-anhydromuramyl-L-alanine amidase AmpD
MAKKIQTTPRVPIYLRRSPVTELSAKPRDVRDQKLPAKRIVLHVTGRQTYLNAKKAKQPPLERIEEYFTKDGNPFAHYAIDPWGRRLQIAEESERPWAQGWAKYGGKKKLFKELEEGKRIAPNDWQSHWRVSLNFNPFQTFVQTVLGGVDTPNDRSIAIEFIQYGNQFKLTEAQYYSGHILMRDIALRHEMPFDFDCDDRQSFFGHEDVDPWGRMDKNGQGWDPGAIRDKPRFCWHCMLTLDFSHLDYIGRLPPVNRRTGLCRCILPTPPMPEWAR